MLLRALNSHSSLTQEILGVCVGHNVHAQVLDRKHEQMRRLYVQLAAAAGKDKANHTRTALRPGTRKRIRLGRMDLGFQDPQRSNEMQVPSTIVHTWFYFHQKRTSAEGRISFAGTSADKSQLLEENRH